MGQHLYKKIHQCSIEGCPRTTTATRWLDPRDRWMLEIPLKEEDGTVIILTLCPEHVRKQFDLQEAHYVELEKSEAMVRASSAERPA